MKFWQKLSEIKLNTIVKFISKYYEFWEKLKLADIKYVYGHVMHSQ